MDQQNNGKIIPSPERLFRTPSHHAGESDSDDSDKTFPDNVCGSLDAMGEVIRKYRKKAGLTQAELAAAVDVTRNAVISWENGRARPQMETLMKVSHLLAIPVVELFDVGCRSDATGGKDQSDQSEPASLQSYEQTGRIKTGSYPMPASAADSTSPNVANVAGLTVEEKGILSNYRRLNPENQQLAARIMQVFVDDEASQRIRMLENDYHPLGMLLTPAAAGTGCDYLDSLAVEIHFYRINPRYRNADLVCRVSGHSMEPYYHNGDLVYGRIASDAEDGSDVICDSNDGRLIKRKSGNTLVSLNPDPRYAVHKSPDDDVRIVAVVLGIVPEEDKVDPDTEPVLEEIHMQEVNALRSRYHIS